MPQLSEPANRPITEDREGIDAHTHSHPITVARLLAENLFEGTLIGGGTGIDHTVSWCMPFTQPAEASDDELVDAAVHAPPGAFSNQDVAGVVEHLARAGAGMLVLQMTSEDVRHELPELTTAADAAALPVLAVGQGGTFRETSRLVATKVLAQAQHVLEYGTTVHRALGDVFARGAGLAALARKMAQISETYVLIVGNNAELLAEASPTATAPRLSPAVVERVIEQMQTTVPDDDEAHHHTVESLVLEVDEERVEIVQAPVQVAGQPYGLLVLVEPVSPAPEHDLARHRVIVEQGVSLTGSELLRLQSVRQAEERARNDFAHALLHGRFTDELELSSRAEHYRLPVDGRFAVFVVTTPAINPDDDSARRIGREVERTVRALASPDVFTLSATLGSLVVVVVQLRKRRGSDREAAKVTKELQTFGQQLHRALAARVGGEVRIAYGRPFNGAAGIAKSYREARTAEGLARRVQTPVVCSYTDLRVFAAIEECAATASGRDFASEVLAPLRHLDGHSGNLEELVLAYIEEGGNLNATARRLHLHRNTMLYKLERASRALQMDVRSTETQFMVWFAHHITALNDVVEALDRELAPPR